MLGGPSNIPLRTERKNKPQQQPPNTIQNKSTPQTLPNQIKKKSNKNKSERNVISLTI